MSNSDPTGNPLVEPPGQDAELQPLQIEFAGARAIAPSLMAAATEVVENRRAYETYEVLGWGEASPNWQTRKPHDFSSLLVFRNFDNTVFTTKPEKPRTDSEGKVIKYETPKGPSDAYLPAIDPQTRAKIAQVQGVEIPEEVEFWDWVLANPQVPIVLTEGPKSLALLSAGYIAIAVNGCWGATRSKNPAGLQLETPKLTETVKTYSIGRRIVLAMDCDLNPKTIRTVNKAIALTGRLIEVSGGESLVATWNPQNGEAKGVDDLIATGGETAWQQAFESSVPLNSWEKSKMLDSQNVVSIHTGQPVVPVDSLDVEIRKILDRNLPIAQLQAQKIKLRQSSALQDREFNQLWDVVDRDYEAGEESNPDEIRRLLQAKQSSLKLGQVLPGAIAQPLTELAKMMNLREEVYLVSALTVIGSVVQNGTTLQLNRRTGYSVTPNLFSAIVAPPSQRKSPVISAIATKPLRKLERKAKEAYQRALAAWEDRKLEAKNNGEDFHEQQPAREIFFFNRASGEAILQQAERSPRRGLLNLSDELAGAFKSKNQYRGGRGSDGEDMLSYYDGEGGKTLRVDGVRNDVGTINYGVLGGIQPRVLEKFLGSCEDDNGNWARYIFVHQPIAAATWQEDDGQSIDVPELLATHYELISEYEPTEYRLSPAASAKFGQLYNDYEKRRVNEPNPALQAVIGKSAGRVGKVALNLHLLEAAARCRAVPDLEISVETIERAAMVAEFAIEQIAAIYSDCDTQSNQSPVMARIVELSRRKGAVSAREIYQALPSRSDRPNTARIRQFFTELAENGFGKIVGEGKSVQFHAFSEQVTPEPIPEAAPEPKLTPGDYVEIAPGAPNYGNNLTGQSLFLVRFDLDSDRAQYWATVMDSNGDNHSVWVCHLQRSTNPAEIQEAS